VSIPTLSRVLRRDLNLTRKKLEKRAREATVIEQRAYARRLGQVYMYPEQLVFIDETSKDGRSIARKYGWSVKGTKCIVAMPSSRGKRLSVLAALDIRGFFSWAYTEDTFTRQSFHDAFVSQILPYLNPYPWPRSIVVIDNARIHMYEELEIAVHSKGAVLLYLPPYIPHLNPIETAFSLLKAWIMKRAHLVYPKMPREVMEIGLRACASEMTVGRNSFAHSGYMADHFTLLSTSQFAPGPLNAADSGQHNLIIREDSSEDGEDSINFGLDDEQNSELDFN
jgi:hypothetical protein